MIKNIKEKTLFFSIQYSGLFLMQKNHCSAFSTEWNKLENKQSYILLRRKVLRNPGTDLVHVALFALIETVLTVALPLHVCARCLRMHVNVCMFWARNLNVFIYCGLLVKVNILKRTVSYLEQYCQTPRKLLISFCKRLWRNCLRITLQWYTICKKKLNSILSS